MQNDSIPSDPRDAVPATPATPPRRERPWRLAAILGLIVLAAILVGALPRWRARTALGAETRELAVPTVSVVSPSPGKGGKPALWPAEIKPQMEAPVLSRASGYVKRWTTDIGGPVKAGALLAELETPELDQELERARQELAQTEAALKLARSTAQRYASAVGVSGVSEQENAERQSDVVLKAAATTALGANVRRLEKLRSFARITAPFAGTITARRVDVGDLVVGGSSRELFRLAQTGTLRVSFRVPQTIALGVAPGQAAEVLIPELPGRVFEAKVARTAGAISADSRTLLVELELPNPRGEMLAGAYAQVRLLGAKRPPALTLPANALLFGEDGPRVGVVRADGHVELRSIRLGRDFGKSVEILSGVGPDDKVILNPSDSLMEGAVVRVAVSAGGEKMHEREVADAKEKQETTK